MEQMCKLEHSTLIIKVFNFILSNLRLLSCPPGNERELLQSAGNINKRILTRHFNGFSCYSLHDFGKLSE